MNASDTADEQSGAGWLTPVWSAPPRVFGLSTLRGGGCSRPPFEGLNLASHVGDEDTAVAANRAALRQRAQLPREPVWLAQVHGTAVVELELGPVARPPEADAAVTRAPGLVCAVLTADCLPVLLAARDGSVIGAVHAGWRGLAGGVLEAALVAMRVEASSVVAWLGPAIGPQHFEVGADVRAALLRFDEGAEGAFTLNGRGRYMADLWELARRRLERAGVSDVSGGGFCTYGDPKRFYSHRRDQRTGRQATLIWLQ